MVRCQAENHAEKSNLQGAAHRFEPGLADSDDENVRSQSCSSRDAPARFEFALSVTQIPSRVDEPVDQKDRREDDGGDHRCQADLGVGGINDACRNGGCNEQPERHFEILHSSSCFGVVGASADFSTE